MFKINDLLIDRVLACYAYSLKGEPLFVLTQLNSFQMQYSSDNQDFNGSDGSLIKRVFRNRSAEITATNAMFNLPITATMGGTDMETGKGIEGMPRILTTKETQNSIADLKTENGTSVKVCPIGTNGALGEPYTNGADGTGTFTVSDGKLTINPKDGDTKWFVYYTRTSDTGAKITISGNKFPRTMSLLVRALAYDPCAVDTPKSLYIQIPSFQASPDLDLNIQNDGTTLDFSGICQVAYCDDEKAMARIWFDPDDDDDDTF